MKLKRNGVASPSINSGTVYTLHLIYFYSHLGWINVKFSELME